VPVRHPVGAAGSARGAGQCPARRGAGRVFAAANRDAERLEVLVIGEHSLPPRCDDLAHEVRQFAVVALDVGRLAVGVSLEFGHELVGHRLDRGLAVVRPLDVELDLAVTDGGPRRIHRELGGAAAEQLFVAREGDVHDRLAARDEHGLRVVEDGPVTVEAHVYLARPEVFQLHLLAADDERFDGEEISELV